MSKRYNKELNLFQQPTKTQIGIKSEIAYEKVVGCWMELNRSFTAGKTSDTSKGGQAESETLWKETCGREKREEGRERWWTTVVTKRGSG